MKKLYTMSTLLMICLFLSSMFVAVAQPSKGGTPPSFKTSLVDENQPFIVDAPNVKALLAEDLASSNNAPRAAVVLPVDLNPTNSGEWLTLETGERIWRLAIEAKGANALLLTYSAFNLPKGSKLFIYNKAKTQVLGAYTSENNPTHGPEFSTEFVAGDHIILEYVAPLTLSSETFNPRTGEIIHGLKPQYVMPTINIEGIGYAYNKFVSVSNIFDATKTPSDLGSSGACMVNINCGEGSTWQNQKKGVAATLQKIGASYYICSGSLLNNIREDLSPYFLMAWHCSSASGSSSSAADFNQYQFYFHWERAGCANTSNPITYRTMTGCQIRQQSPLGGGSDGLLVRLNASIPPAYDVYYNGWNANAISSLATGGVSIHHPSGDVKKVSTYNTASSTTANISGYGTGATNAHYTFTFQASANGHSQTEGGSSGSPMFNTAGLVIGTLTGGNSSCTNLTGTNLYGKFSYHFTNENFKQWLDPDNTGALICQGRYASTEPVCNFSVDNQNAFAMQPVQFYSQSFNATSFAWSFPGGNPSSSTVEHPQVTYNVPGDYDVTLSINGGAATKTEVGYMKIREKLNESTITIGTGTTTANYPLGWANNNARVHQATIYTAAQVGAAAELRSIAYNAGTARTAFPSTINIWIQHTTEANVTNVAAWNIGVNPVAIAGGTITKVASYTAQTIAVGWNTYAFNVAPFVYNGTNNIVVYIEVYAASNSSLISTHTNTVAYTATGTNTNCTYQSNATTQPTTKTTNNQVPNIRLIKAMASIMPIANFIGPESFTAAIKENFDALTPATFPPTGWTLIKTHAANNWMLGNPAAAPFSAVEPTNIYSAIVPWIAANQNEQLITLPFVIPNDKYSLLFYTGYGGTYLSYATMHCKIATSDDNYTAWTTIWTAGTTNTGVAFGWIQRNITLATYAGKTVKIQWQYIGNDGDLMCIDDVKVGFSDPLGKYEMFKDQALNLTDLSQGPPVVWDWKFPGSHTPEVQSFGPVPSVRYQYAGTYDLGLKVTNLHGSNTKDMPEQLIVKDRSPLANFITKSSGYDAIGAFIDEYHPFLPPGGSVNYIDVSKNLPDNYKWIFPNGTPATSTDKNPLVTYNNSGDFGASLTVANSAGTHTKTQSDLVYVNYTPENITNANIEGGSFAVWTGGTNMYIGGSGIGTQIAEYYKAPASPGKITKILAYVGGKGTGSRAYTLNIVRPNASGLPTGTVLYTAGFNINTLPATGLVEFTLPTPLEINEPFFVRVDNFTTWAATTGLHFLVTMGTEIPEDQNSTAMLYYNSNWVHVSTLFLGKPGASIALWPEFTYTQLDVNPINVTVASTVGNKLVPVTANTTYTTNTLETWFTLAIEATGVRVNYTTNATGSPRQGTFNVVGGGITRTVTVLQASVPLALNVTPATQTIASNVGSATLNVTSNVLWTATSDAQWAIIAIPTGVDNGVITVNAAANLALQPRTATITVFGGDITRTVTITQSPSNPYLEIDPEGVISVPAMNGSRDIEVTSNGSWLASSNVAWITFAQQGGIGDGRIYFDFGINPNATPRTGVITVVGSGYTKTLTVNQAAGVTNFSIEPNVFSVAAAAGSQNAVLKAAGAWTAQLDENAPWLTLNTLSGGAGNTNLIISYTVNASPISRTGILTFSNGIHYRYISVTQLGAGVLVNWTINGLGDLIVLANGNPVTNGGSAQLNSILTINANPAVGSYLQTITVNGNAYTAGTAIVVTEALTIVAAFDNKYVLTLNPAPTSVTPTTINVTYGAAVGTMPNPTARPGYTFTGWFIGATQITAATVWNYASNQTANALWTVNTYVLTFNPTGGTVTPTSKVVTYDAAIGTLPTPTRTGYAFNGWRIGATQITAATVWNYTANQTADAQWTANTYTLTFNPGAGTVTPTSKVVTYDAAIGVLPTPARTGYTFVKWQIGTTDITAATVWTYLANQTATAVWTANNYTLTFNPMGGTVAPTTLPVTYDLAIGTLPVPVRTGSNFLGWYIGTTQIFGSTIWNYASNQTATASWTNPITLTNITPTLGNTNPVPGTIHYNPGQNATYTFTPNVGCHISRIIVDGVLENITVNPELTAPMSYTFTNIQAPHTIAVTFAINYYTLNPNNIYGTGASATLIPDPIIHGTSGKVTFGVNCSNITDVIIGGISRGIIAEYNFNNVTAPLPIIEIKTQTTYFNIAASPSQSTSDEGWLTPAGNITVECGTAQTFQIQTSPGYRASRLIVDGTTVAVPDNKHYTFNNVRAHHTIAAEFELYPQFLINFSPSFPNAAGGYIYYEYDDQAVNYVFIDSADNAKFFIVPLEGYVIDMVLVDGLINPQALANGYHVFPQVKVNHTIIATFKKISFTVTATAAAGGTITPSGNVSVNYAENATFVIAPNAGFSLATVLVDGVNNPAAVTDGFYTFTNVKENHTISATFVKNYFVISTTAGANGTITPINPMVEYGTNQIFTFTPSVGYKVVSVMVDGISNPGAVVQGNYTFVNVTAEHTIAVVFGKITYSITATAGAGGSVAPSGTVTLDYGANSAIYVFQPQAGYILKTVLVDGVADAQAVINGFYRFLNVTANHTLLATFVPASYTIVASASAGGTMAPTGTAVVAFGESKMYTFAPNVGFKINAVLIDGINNPSAVLAGNYTFSNVAANHTISVIFSKKTYTVTLPTNVAYTIVPVNGSSSPVEHGEQYQFRVVLNASYNQSQIVVYVNDFVVTTSAGVYTIFNITADQVVRVENVMLNQYPIVSQTNVGGTITPAGITYVTHGDNQSYFIEASQGYAISKVFVNGEDVGAVETYTFNNVTATAMIDVQFKYTVGINDETGININVFSYGNVVSIVNEKLVPISEVAIMDMFGRVVWQGVAPSVKNDITLNVPVGVYAVRINTIDNHYLTTKVQITK